MLTGQQLLAAEPFDDAIATAAWPMELRESAKGPKWRYPHGGEPQIPLRSLRVKDRKTFFVAGRCIGADHEAQAAIRVMGTCLATGEAAGLAAAIQARQGSVSAADIRQIQPTTKAT